MQRYTNEECQQIYTHCESDSTLEEIIEVLHICDDLYFNGSESPLSDEQYDFLRYFAHSSDPSNVYFTGVGSEVRGEKVRLPYPMGSLDQIEVGNIQNWVKKHNLRTEELIISNKMDGQSCLLVYGENGDIQIAYSRGDGTMGADITRHIMQIQNVPFHINQRLVVRAEIELSDTSFEKLKTLVKSRSGKPYSNARNMVSGLMNSKTNPEIVYEYLDVIAYEILNIQNMSKIEQLNLLKKEKFHVVGYTRSSGNDLTDELLSKHINKTKQELDYQIDGMVIEVNSSHRRNQMNPTKDTLNPAYAIKYKVLDDTNYAETRINSIEWNISKSGYLKPRLMLETVALAGVMVSHTTGYNAKFIKDNALGAGSIVGISRMGDVIPNVVKIVESTQADLPVDNKWVWNDTGVDIVLVDIENNPEVRLQQALDFFVSIDSPGIKEGTIKTLFKYDIDSIEKIILTDRNTMVRLVGENGNKIFNGLEEKLTSIPLYVLLGSLPFFGRGVGKRKFKKLLSTLNIININELNKLTEASIVGVDGFEQKTALKILEGLEKFESFYLTVATKINFQETEVAATNSVLLGEKLVFTGFRDKQLEALVVGAGGEVQTSFNKKTTCVVAKDVNESSGKLQKARDSGIRIISGEELQQMLGVNKIKNIPKKQPGIADDIFSL